jgi:lipopolysaccharide assembly outer membrane protein LptD (OstA)
MKLRTSLAWLACLFCLVARAAETNDELVVEGDAILQLNSDIVTYPHGVFVKYGPAVLTADTARIDQKSGEISAGGNVYLLREGGQVWRGDQLNYNYKTRVISGNNYRAGQPPYFLTGESLITIPTNNSYITTNGYFSTDDVPVPGYRIRAKKIIIVPGKSIEARHAIAYLGDVPVFYFPYYHKEFGRHPNNYEFLAGYRSQWGPFLLNTFNWYWNERLDGAVNLDLRGQRGIAGGPDFSWHDQTFGEGLLRYYYAQDENPHRVFGYQTPDHERQRLFFADQWNLRSNLTAKAAIAYQSDPFIIRDFFESEYHGNVQPKSFVEVDQAWRNWDLNALAQFRVNDFQETVERLPDVKLTGLRQQLGPTPLYYESESSIGYYRHVFPAETNGIFSPAFTNYFGATRADTYHQIVAPKMFFGWINFIPRVGQRFTYYSRANERGGTTDEEVRNVFNTGAEITWKASRVYRDAESELLDVHGLRHIIEPSINYVYVPDPDVRPHEAPQFDSQLPSSRLLPIEFPDYNSIDSIDSQNVVRWGLRNKLQTKREEGIDDLLNWAVYMDWRLTPHHHQPGFSEIYSDMDFKPRSWISFNSETRYSIHEGQFREANHMVTIQPGEDWSLSLGHRYRDNTRELGQGNNLILATFYYRLNENWGLRTQHIFEARDGVLEYQYYTIYRDFRSWTSALTFRLRETRFGADDYTVAFTLSFKAFPRFKLGSDTVHPQHLIGG